MIARLRAAVGPGELAAAVRGIAGGPAVVAEFERAFAARFDQHDAVAFPYGRTGLIVLLRALGVSGKQVICPAYTCVVVAHAIVTAGATPVFVDCGDDMNMDLELAAEAIDPGTHAIVPTSLFGHPVDLDALDGLRTSHPRVAVVQDCAHSFDASWRGRSVVGAGDAAVFGLNISKVMTSIFGGMITTSSADLASVVRAERDAILRRAGRWKSALRTAYLFAASAAFLPPAYTIVHELVRRGTLAHFTDYYDPALIEMPTDYLQSMAAAEAAVGVVQLRKYSRIVEHRRACARVYDAELDGLESIVRPSSTDGATYSHYVIRTEHAERIVEKLRDAGVEAGRLIEYLIPAMPAYSSATFFDRGVGRSLPARVVNLPVHLGVTLTDARRIAGVVRSAA